MNEAEPWMKFGHLSPSYIAFSLCRPSHTDCNQRLMTSESTIHCILHTSAIMQWIQSMCDGICVHHTLRSPHVGHHALTSIIVWWHLSTPITAFLTRRPSHTDCNQCMMTSQSTIHCILHTSAIWFHHTLHSPHVGHVLLPSGIKHTSVGHISKYIDTLQYEP